MIMKVESQVTIINFKFNAHVSTKKTNDKRLLHDFNRN